MHTLFSHEIFSTQGVGGISRCMIELMRAFPANADWSVWPGQHRNRLLQTVQGEAWTAGHIANAEFTPAIGRLSGSIRNEPGFAKFVRQQDVKVVHRSYHPTANFVGRSAAVVETLHDMVEERWDGRQRLTRWPRILLKRRALQRADAIVCVSQHTQDELRKVWPELVGRSIVVHHGVRLLSSNPVNPARARPYFLFVGDRRGYKNWGVVLDAMTHNARLHDIDLVCFGGGAFSPAEAQLLVEKNISDRVTQIGGGDDILAGLYGSAAALVYPSRYEGFGMPLLEAMIHDCPVIAATIDPLREVGGEAALYADPGSVEQWSAAMEQVLGDGQLRASLVASGAKRVKSFSWEAAAQAYQALYRSLR